jgi:hypothetical protein
MPPTTWTWSNNPAISTQFAGLVNPFVYVAITDIKPLSLATEQLSAPSVRTDNGFYRFR